MPEYLHPGVFVEEVSSGVRPIEGVGTSTAGFVGITAKGVPNKATFISSWSQFVRAFGYLIPNSYLPYAVSQFFANGGKRCYVVRALNQISSKTAAATLNDRESSSKATLQVRAKGAGSWGNGLIIKVSNGTNNPTSEFKILVSQDDPANTVELWDNLSMDPSSQDYVETSINDLSDFIEVKDLSAAVTPATASLTTANVLANPVPFAGGGETLVLETTDGTQNTVTFTGNTTPANVVANINTAWAAFNVAASQDAAGKLVIRLTSPGYDKYVILSGTATAAGRPLEGLAGFAQGAGAAVGAVLKSAAAANFDTTGGKNVFNITVNGDALPAVNVTAAAAVTPATLVADFTNEFASKAKGLVRASLEGNRVVISTVNTGASNTALQIGGAGDTALTFRRFDRGGASNAVVNGQGRSEAAFVQSAPGPFALPEGSNFSIITNNGALGAKVNAQVNIATGATFPNLAQVTAGQLVNAINAAAGGNFTATVEGASVIVRSNRKGPFYNLQVKDGLKSPNIQIRFETSIKSGYAEGDAASPYIRPAVATTVLAAGDDGGAISNSDLIGSAALKTGLHAFDDVTDVNILAIPGAFDPSVVSQAVGYCTTRRDCFFLCDPPGKTTKDTPTEDPPKVLDFVSNQITTKTSYGALYYPWMLIADDVGAGKNPTRYVPPSGFIAGLYARIDNTRGVWKAPAGTEASVIGPISLEYSVTDSEQDILNPVGVNCIRQFAASGIVAWGARTLSTQSDPEWRYIPVRRYAIYLEQSIYRGTQWAVFEPNDERLWASLKANIEDFLMGEFRKGALAGTTPQQAFQVKCDADLNPFSEVSAGRVNMEVRFAPLKPAEFVIIRISQLVQRPSS
jgi:phage tail sheath protein FI